MNISQWINNQSEQFTKISDKIWNYAEIGYKEYQSAAVLADTLEESGFAVERGVGGIPTAFMASYGTQKPVISILGEYDALPGLSQALLTHKAALAGQMNGHGCGHNLLGVGALAASLAVKQLILEGELTGTIRFYGCPAEENGSGKAFMVKSGLFDDVDLCLTWHPGMINGAVSVNMLANYKVKFSFKGISAHAAADPFNGRSALDAVELMNVGVNFLREHIIPEARIHYAITNSGGNAPNVVQPEADVLYMLRAPTVKPLIEIYERVQDIARGAALMTGTQMQVNFHAGASNLLLNDTIVDVLSQKMYESGVPHFTEEERSFAAELSAGFPKGAGMLDTLGKTAGPKFGQFLLKIREEILSESILPPFKRDIAMPGSTDVGDVSWVVPTGQFMTVCHAFGTPGHSWQQVAQSGMSIGHKGMLFAARVLGLTAAEFMLDPALLKKAKDEFAARRRDNPYISPIPDGVLPPLEEKLEVV